MTAADSDKLLQMEGALQSGQSPQAVAGQIRAWLDGPDGPSREADLIESGEVPDGYTASALASPAQREDVARKLREQAGRWSEVADRMGGEGSGPPSRGAPEAGAVFSGPQEQRLAAAQRAIEGTYGRDGYRVSVDSLDVISGDSHATIKGTIRDSRGRKIGSFERILERDPDTGGLSAYHESLKLSRATQGSGFAEDFNRNLYDWYRRSGITRVDLEANQDVGGYAWATQGYDFKDERAARAWLEAARRKANGPASRRPGAPSPEQLAELRAYLDDIEAGRVALSAPDIARFGRQPGQGGRDAMWPGKWLMLGKNMAWIGRLYL
jgi:hypothetical protein